MSYNSQRIMRHQLPPNTRIKNGYIEFRKQYNGASVCRTWPVREKAHAVREIYDLLHKMSSNQAIIVEIEHRMTVEEACDTYRGLHGPSLKGGVTEETYSPYYRLGNRLKFIKRAWSGRYWETLTPYDVRDFILQFDTVGTRMKFLNTLAHMFRCYEEWNEEGTILKTKVKVPKGNPASKWRRKMKSSDKKELPRTRVLSPEEWNTFKFHLSPSAREICELALRRFLRLADIKQVSRMIIKGDVIEGVQAKTGTPFRVPVLANQPVRYVFTNFRNDFHRAQVLAKLDFPIDHPLHFTVRDLRRTGATWAYQRTKDIVGISKMLGHSDLTTTQRYLGIDQNNLRAIAEAVDEIADLGKKLGKNVPNDSFQKSQNDLKISTI